MIVLPNSFERYLNNLRIYTSLSIIKHGILRRHLYNLRKIHLAEAFLYKNNKESINLKLLTFNILCCVKTVKNFNFKIDLKKNVIINKNLYVILLLMLSLNSSSINVKFKNGIIIKGKCEIKNTQKLILFLNGHSFFDIKTKKFLIYIPCKTTTLPPVPTISQWELIFDKFSIFNLFFE